MFQMTKVEQRCVWAIAQIRGGTPQPKDGEWPDGRIHEPGGQQIAVEVVTAYPENDATAWVRAKVQGLAKARSIEERTGHIVPTAVRNGRPIVLDGRTAMPPSTRPVDPTIGICNAIAKKSEHYGRAEASSTILAVYHVQWPDRLDPGRLQRIADYAAQIEAPFREIWIVNEYRDPAQRAV
jgi:hypothetical protein